MTFKAPVVGLLHASPLKNNFAVNTAQQSEEEIADLEIERERFEMKQALQQTNKHVVMESRPLTRENLLHAFKTCDIILLGAHGVAGGGIVVESNVYQGELMTAKELGDMVYLVKSRNELACKFCFVSSCYSEPAGRMLVENGIEHVVTIAGDNRISNLVSRGFFSRVLTALLVEQCTVLAAVECGLQFVETHPELPAHRRGHQREKFIYHDITFNNNNKKDRPLFAGVLDSGTLEDVTQTSALVGFPFASTVQQPGPIFGRQEMIQDILSTLLLSNNSSNNRLVVLKQTAQGMGSSLIVHFVACYLATRVAFDTIELVQSFAVAAERLLQATSNTLVMVDPESEQEEEERKFWKLAGTNYQCALLVVSKFAASVFPRGVVPFQVEPLKPKYVLKFLEYLVKGNASKLAADEGGNPLEVIAKAKASRLSHQQSFTQLIESVQDELPPIWRSSRPPAYVSSQRYSMRTLTSSELAFLDQQRLKFPTQQAFWQTWFWPTLQALVSVERYWQHNLIVGFINETDCNALLLQQQQPVVVGAFILRFSERNPGTLTLSHVKASQGEVGKVTLTITPTSVSAKKKDGTMEKFAGLRQAVLSFTKLTHLVVVVDEDRHVRLVPVKEAFAW